MLQPFYSQPVKSLLMVVLATVTALTAASQERSNYGNTPDELVPYGHYQKAYKMFFDEPQAFYGPGRDKEAPKNLQTVRIGFLGPLAGSYEEALGRQMLQGSMLAIEEANARGGYNGLPFELMKHNDVGLWGAAANTIVEMDEEGVWAILGSIDGIVTHVALRVALKLEIPMVNTGDPDPTLTETRIPWIIRVIGDDRQSSYALANEIYVQRGLKQVAVMRTNQRYGRVGIKEFSDASTRLGHPLLFELQFAEGDTSFTKQLNRIADTPAEAIVIWGNAREIAGIVKEMRTLGMDQPVFGSDRLVSEEFLALAGKHAEGIVSTYPYNPTSDNEKLQQFNKDYFQRFGMEPDVFAAHAYDGMNLIIASIRQAGLNRVKIRDLLTDLKTFQGYQGVTGEIMLDASWNDIGDIWMVEIKNSEFVFSPVKTGRNQ
jgi:ABC-type branched-subunit amino acid transport system substrate-binding protein